MWPSLLVGRVLYLSTTKSDFLDIKVKQQLRLKVLRDLMNLLLISNYHRDITKDFITINEAVKTYGYTLNDLAEYHGFQFDLSSDSMQVRYKEARYKQVAVGYKEARYKQEVTVRLCCTAVN